MARFLLTLMAIISFTFTLLRIRKTNLKELGIVQVKVLVLVLLLIIFNEPFYNVRVIRHWKFYSVMQTGLEATYLGFLLHFWAFLLDTLVANNVRSEPMRFYLPKLILVILIWVFITVSAIATKFREIEGTSDFWRGESMQVFSWGLSILLIAYGAYLILLVSKAFRYINYMKENFKLVFILTILVISIVILCMIFNGIQAYISE